MQLLVHFKWEFFKTLHACLLPMKIHISLQQFDGLMFKGVIALFDLEYFIKKFIHTTHTC